MSETHYNWRWQYPCVCEECKRTPLLSKTYVQHVNVGYEWEDELSYTTCILCLIRGKLRGILSRFKQIEIELVRSDSTNRPYGIILYTVKSTSVLYKGKDGKLKYKSIKNRR